MTTIKDLTQNSFGHVVLTKDTGTVYEDVHFVCAFPLSAPTEQIAIVTQQGKEVGILPSLTALPENWQSIVKENLHATQLTLQIHKINSISDTSAPCVWEVATNRGPTQLHLEKEESIQLTGFGFLLIQDSRGISFLINPTSIDKKSKRFLDHFCIL